MKPSTVLIAIAALASNTLAAPAGTSIVQAQQRDMALQTSHTGDAQFSERSIQMSDAPTGDMAKRDAAAFFTDGLLGSHNCDLLCSVLVSAVKTKLLYTKAFLDNLKMGKEALVKKLLQALGVDLNKSGASKSPIDVIDHILADGSHGSNVTARGG